MDRENESVTVSVRQIENGYVKTVSKSEGGTYTCHEEFSETKPDVSAAPESRPAGRSSLRDAVKSLR